MALLLKEGNGGGPGGGERMIYLNVREREGGMALGAADFGYRV